MVPFSRAEAGGERKLDPRSISGNRILIPPAMSTRMNFVRIKYFKAGISGLPISPLSFQVLWEKCAHKNIYRCIWKIKTTSIRPDEADPGSRKTNWQTDLGLLFRRIKKWDFSQMLEMWPTDNDARDFVSFYPAFFFTTQRSVTRI